MSRGLASTCLRNLSTKLMRLWLRSCMVCGFSIGRSPAMTRGADFIMCCPLKPIIIAMLSVHTSIASPSPLIHSGMENIVPSATVEVASSPARIPTFPAVFEVALTHLSATLPNNGDTVPVTEPSKVPCRDDFSTSPAEYPSFSPVCGLMCPPCSHWLSPSLMPSYVPRLPAPPAMPATTRPVSVLPNNRAPTLVAVFFATMRPPILSAVLPVNEPTPPDI